MVIIFYFLCQISAACVDSALQNVDNRQTMRDGGWILDIDEYQNYGHCCMEPKTFWGYKHKSPVGVVKATFKGSGKATLNFGNCYEGGVTKAYLNDLEIGSASSYQYPNKTFNFNKGDTLKLTEEDSGIIKINSLSLSGCQ